MALLFGNTKIEPNAIITSATSKLEPQVDIPEAYPVFGMLTSFQQNRIVWAFTYVDETYRDLLAYPYRQGLEEGRYRFFLFDISDIQLPEINREGFLGGYTINQFGRKVLDNPFYVSNQPTLGSFPDIDKYVISSMTFDEILKYCDKEKNKSFCDNPEFLQLISKRYLTKEDISNEEVKEALNEFRRLNHYIDGYKNEKLAYYSYIHKFARIWPFLAKYEIALPNYLKNLPFKNIAEFVRRIYFNRRGDAIDKKYLDIIMDSLDSKKRVKLVRYLVGASTLGLYLDTTWMNEILGFLGNTEYRDLLTEILRPNRASEISSALNIQLITLLTQKLGYPPQDQQSIVQQYLDTRLPPEDDVDDEI